MGSRTTFNGYVRQRGTNSRHSSTATPAVGIYALPQYSIADISAASAATGLVLPAGSKYMGCQITSTSTAGTNETIDIGTSSDSDAFQNEVPTDTVNVGLGGAGGTAGTNFNTTLTADTEIYVGVGAVSGTGACVIVFFYRMEDDGSEGTS